MCALRWGVCLIRVKDGSFEKVLSMLCPGRKVLLYPWCWGVCLIRVKDGSFQNVLSMLCPDRKVLLYPWCWGVCLIRYQVTGRATAYLWQRWSRGHHHHQHIAVQYFIPTNYIITISMVEIILDPHRIIAFFLPFLIMPVSGKHPYHQENVTKCLCGQKLKSNYFSCSGTFFIVCEYNYSLWL